MATAATSLLGLALPVTGELSGTWGDTVNVSITALLDSAVAGTTTLSSDADVTLTTTTLAANQARQAIILWTAGGTATRTITVPAQSKAYIVINKTSSSQSIKIVGAGPTTGVTIVAGTAAFVVWNGVDFVTASVTSTTGILPVANGGTGLSSGTSGGVLAYTAAGTLASSAALAASALVIGGGAGAAPSTTTTGTGVVTALGVNTGTAGAFVVNGGALGTPSSGTVTNLTGTASININGTVGATTATTGAFTTLSATKATAGDVITFTNGGATPKTGFLYSDASFVALTTGAGITGNGLYFNAATNNSGIVFINNATIGAFSSTGLAVTGTLSATGTLSGGTSGTAYSFSGSAPATSLTLDSAGVLTVFSPNADGGKIVIQSGTLINNNRATLFMSSQNVNGQTGNVSIECLHPNNQQSDMVFRTGATDATSFGTERMRLDTSGNLGLGVTPSAWGSPYKAIQVGTTGTFAGRTDGAANQVFLSNNYYYNGSADVFITTGYASRYFQNAGLHRWDISTISGAAPNDPISFTQAMTLDASGNLGIGETTPSTFGKLVVKGGTINLVTDTAAQRRVSFWSQGNGNSENAYIQVQNDGATTNTGEILFATKNSSGTLAERARIDSAGVFKAGTIQASGSGVGSFSASKWFIQSEDSTTTRAYYTGPDASTKGSWEIYAATSTGSAVLAGRFNASANFVAQNIGLGATIPTTSGTGITFPATQSASSDANTLDDYEEGTFTPTPIGVTVNSGTPVWSMIYTKIGRQVTVTWQLTGGANVSIAVGNSLSLPFSATDVAWGSYGNNSSSAFIGGIQAVAGVFYFGTASTLVAGGGTVVFQV